MGIFSIFVISTVH
ncbi:TPA: ErmCL family antibiotic resistance leader peptide, partial [Staphylococcus aureus]|nr:ErmCL family antibiotic resistance leader peptide [Staphylococcus aureus]HDB7545842.1 ErmCL family antibiotic resistance leader peptide [Staphylococcus aureus]HDC7693116.1 ErmCL family antibiotic resistance leader peptide [Staphylococcus aureus]HEG7681722.1 ErmCL family antibiotic resistance leader peptide [Staphylococcus aureus]HEG7681795.1 ErmCL family antibiotic resistance leader peptide [Staphylococcus aureus]